MNLIGKFTDWLTLPEARGLDLDAPEATGLHSAIIQRKSFLKNIYTDFYKHFARAAEGTPPGLWLELGSGGGFLKAVIPKVTTSDVQFLPTVDLMLSGERLPFKDNSLSAIFMLNTFHHLPDAYLFLQEVTRCLKPGGKLVMTEPANTSWGRFVYTRFHHERFDPKGAWRFTQAGPLSTANGALPWIVFQRDRGKFEHDFPELVIRAFACHTPLRYLVSGGVSKRQLVPSKSYKFFQALEWLLQPLNPWLGMFLSVELQKVGLFAKGFRPSLPADGKVEIWGGA